MENSPDNKENKKPNAAQKSLKGLGAVWPRLLKIQQRHEKCCTMTKRCSCVKRSQICPVVPRYNGNRYIFGLIIKAIFY